MQSSPLRNDISVQAQSLPQSSHPEYTNQHTVFQCQLMGLSQIIAKGI